MKILKTANYFKKQGQWQDPNLPPGVNQSDIDKRFGEPEYDLDERGTETLEIEDLNHIFTVTLEYRVFGFRDDPKNWEVNYKLIKVKNNRGQDITEVSKKEDIPCQDMIENAIKIMILNI